MMNKKLLALLVAGAISLTGCNETTSSGEPTNSNYEAAIKTSLARQSSVKFNLLGSDADIPLPSYILMDTTDGTLNIPLGYGEDTSRMNPKVAMGDTDGWSPTQAFTVNLDLPANVTLDTNPLVLNSAVKVMKVTVTNGVFSSPTPLTAGQDYAVLSSNGKSINVLPLNGAFESSADYIFALTDSLADSDGEPLGMSSSYAMLKTKNTTQEGTLKTPQLVTYQTEGMMLAAGQVSSTDNIIYSSWFTTSSAGDVMYFTKVATASALGSIQAGGTANAVWQGSANPNNIDLTGLYSLQLSSDAATPLSATTSYYKGTIKLPSFVERDVANAAWKTTPWKSGMPSLAILADTLSNGSVEEIASLTAQLIAEGIDPTNLADTSEQLKLVGKSFTLPCSTGNNCSNGTKPLDSERLITKYSPLPQVKSVEDVNFILITPNSASDSSKVPVVIYQHGITSVKENMLLAANGIIDNYAILAIDLPLHGERALSDGTVTDAANPDVFMNFTYLPVGRDNMRQAVADQLGLRAGIAMLSGANNNALDVINNGQVSFLGHSLGAMTGINFVATTERTMPTSLAPLEPAFKIDKAALANPGGGIPYLLMNSTSFGNGIKHSLIYAADSNYKNYADSSCSSIEDGTCFTNFYNTAPADTKAKVDSTMTEFAYAAQTVLETVDPYTLADDIAATTPIYMAQVKDDEVIPNQLSPLTASPYSPTGGTAPLFSSSKMNLTAFNSSVNQSPIRHVAKVTEGGHSSFITESNNSAAATTELQSHVKSFLASSGDTVTVVDGSILETP